MKINRLRVLTSFIKKDFINDLSYRTQFILSIFSIMLSVFVFYTFANFFEESSISLDELNNGYFYFLLLGIAVSDMSLQISSVLNQEIRHYQLTGTFEEIISTSWSTVELLSYSFAYPIIRSFFRFAIYIIFGILFFDLYISLEYLTYVLLTLILVIFCFLGIGLIAGAYALAFKKGNPLSAINQFAVMFMGGVFFPIKYLPDWLQGLSNLIPITHSLEIIRNLLSDDAYVDDEVLFRLLLLIIFSILLVVLGRYLCLKAIIYGKKSGNLTFY